MKAQVLLASEVLTENLNGDKRSSEVFLNSSTMMVVLARGTSLLLLQAMMQAPQTKLVLGELKSQTLEKLWCTDDACVSFFPRDAAHVKFIRSVKRYQFRYR